MRERKIKCSRHPFFSVMEIGTELERRMEKTIEVHESFPKNRNCDVRKFIKLNGLVVNLFRMILCGSKEGP